MQDSVQSILMKPTSDTKEEMDVRGSPNKEIRKPHFSDDQEAVSPTYPSENSDQQEYHRVQRKPRYNKKGIDANGRPRNFYNPPRNVQRSEATNMPYQESTSYFGNQGQINTLKHKYKTQLCKHFLENGYCPLEQFCQFAHGNLELRQPNDPLPQNFGKTALGAVHSNYRTQPCRYMQRGEQCPFGDSCSFYHNDDEKRSLTDPLPNLPERTETPENVKSFQNRKRKFDKRQNGNTMMSQILNNLNKQTQQENIEPETSTSPFKFSPQKNQNLLQIQNLAQMAATGGDFNPSKYLIPGPSALQTQFENLQLNASNHNMFAHQNSQVQVQEMYQQLMQQNIGNVVNPIGLQNNGQYFKPQKSSNEYSQQTYQKQQRLSSHSKGRKEENTQYEYVVKQKTSAKETNSKDVGATEVPEATTIEPLTSKAGQNAASQ